jgi:hypothetical protein
MPLKTRLRNALPLPDVMGYPPRMNEEIS